VDIVSLIVDDLFVLWMICLCKRNLFVDIDSLIVENSLFVSICINC